MNFAFKTRNCVSKMRTLYQNDEFCIKTDFKTQVDYWEESSLLPSAIRAPVAQQYVFGPNSTISVQGDDDERDALQRRELFLQLCAGAIAESHTLAAQLSQRACDTDACERSCKLALEISPRLPVRNARWVEMLGAF